jgi:uncharacterized protein (DUF885 family)
MPIWILCLSLISLGCNLGKIEVEQEEAVQIANKHLSQVFPKLPLDILRVEVKSEEDRWIVYYHPPEDSTANGPFIVQIRKSDGNIVEGLE